MHVGRRERGCMDVRGGWSRDWLGRIVYVNRTMHGMHVERKRFGGSGGVGRRERGGKIWCRAEGKGKNVFIKCDVARNNNASGLRIKTSITFMRIRKTERDARK